MNVNGPSGLGGWQGIRPGVPARPQGAEEGREAAVRPTRAQEEAAAAQSAAPRGSLPVDAPSGTDPQLWSVLTSEERTFFARARAMGPLTYGPGAQGGPAGPARGGRVDIRI